MPSELEPTTAWNASIAQRVGEEVKRLRQECGLSAVKLAERTELLGYPMSRVLIAKIENGHRAGRLDVAELLVLSAALNVPPVQLLYSDLANGKVEILPGAPSTCWEAVRWFCGESPLPAMPSNSDRLAPDQEPSPEEVKKLAAQGYAVTYIEQTVRDPWHLEPVKEPSEQLRLLREHDEALRQYGTDSRHYLTALGTREIDGQLVRAEMTADRRVLLDSLRRNIEDGEQRLAALRSRMRELGMSEPTQMLPTTDDAPLQKDEDA